MIFFFLITIFSEQKKHLKYLLNFRQMVEGTYKMKLQFYVLNNQPTMTSFYSNFLRIYILS